MKNLIPILALAIVGCVPAKERATYPFPEAVGIQEVISACDTGGFLEGSYVALLRLTPATAATIRSSGLFFLNDHLVGRHSIKLSRWNRTPILTKGPFDGGGYYPVTAEGDSMKVRPTARCTGQRRTIDRETHIKTLSAISRGDAYYATYNGGEGLIIVFPTLGLATYYYMG